VKVFTSHLKPGEAPVMVLEGFSWGAAFFGWVWLLFHRAWVPAALMFAVSLLLLRASGALNSAAPGLALFVLQGMFGRDLVRWSLAMRGYQPGPPVVAANQDGALARLLTERAELTNGLALARL
jgi:hypothetical protein